MRSGVWDEHLLRHRPHSDLKRYFATYYDTLYLQLTKGRPDEELYLRSLAFRNVVLETWLKNTRVRSSRTTLILGVTSNFLALLEIRFLSLQGNTSRQTAQTNMAASHPEITNILTRPNRTLHPDRFITIFNFITLQVQAVAGHHDSLDHYVYTVFAGSRAYLGRTSGERARSTYVCPGIIPRWAEHVRELHATLNGKSPARKTNRYTNLSDIRVGPGLSIIVSAAQPLNSIVKAEAVAISLTQFAANGTQFRHLSEQIRHANKCNRIPRANGRRRNRATVKAKNAARKKLLTDNLDNWGAYANFTPNFYALSEKSIQRTAERYDQWVGSCAKKKKTQEYYSFTYNQLYRRFQTSTTPVNIYDNKSLILLLKGFTTEHLSKVLNWGRYLVFNNLLPDHMYYILQQASLIPSYRPRQRAITSTIDGLRTWECPLAPILL